MRKTETKTIRGVDITVTQMEPMRALPLVPKVATIVLSALDRPGETSAPLALMASFATLEGFDPKSLARELLSTAWARVGDRRVELTSEDAINSVFPGVAALIEAITFAAEVNFADFFDGGEGGVPNLAK